MNDDPSRNGRPGPTDEPPPFGPRERAVQSYVWHTVTWPEVEHLVLGTFAAA